MENEIAEAAEKIGLSSAQSESLWQALQMIRRKKRKSYLLQILLYLGALTVFFPMIWFYSTQLHSKGTFFLSLSYMLIFFGAGLYFWKIKRSRPGGIFASLAIGMFPLVLDALWDVLHISPPLQKIPTLFCWLQTFSTQCELGIFIFSCITFYWIRFSFIPAIIYGSFLCLTGDLTYFLAREEFVNYYGPLSACIGVPLIFLGFFLSKKSLQSFALWNYLFGMLFCFIGLTCWAQTITNESDYLIYFSIHLASFFLSGFFHRKIFLLFSSLGIISYLGHLALHFSDSIFFSYIVAAVGFALILISTLLLQRQKKRQPIEVQKIF